MRSDIDSPTKRHHGPFAPRPDPTGHVQGPDPSRAGFFSKSQRSFGALVVIQDGEPASFHRRTGPSGHARTKEEQWIILLDWPASVYVVDPTVAGAWWNGIAGLRRK